MKSASPRVRDLREIIAVPNFWVLAIMLVGLGLVHYLTPQVRGLPLATHPLGRHAVERIVFILPVAGATFAFGYGGGLITLALVTFIMLPRALFISPYPVDSTLEVVAVGIVGYLVTWMIETQEREKQLRQGAVLRLRAINAVTGMVSGSLDLAQVLDSALDKILEVTQVEVVSIYLLDPEREELVLAASRGLPSKCAQEAAHFSLGESLTGMVGQSGEALVVEDILTDPRVGQCLYRTRGMRSLMAAPLKSRDEVLGVITLADPQCDLFTAQDVELLTSIGGQIGVAIENAELHEDVAQQLRVQHRLNEIANEITSELELDSILQKVLQIAEDLVEADGGLIALFDQKTKLIRYSYIHNLPESLRGVTATEEEGLAMEVMSSGQPSVVEDYQEYPRAISAFVSAGVKSSVAVPIVSGDRSFGTLALVSLGEPQAFSERDVAILKGIGRQAGIAVENARLYENLRFYVQRITRAQEEERKRVARELHDETVQMLVVISRRLDKLSVLAEQLPEDAVEDLRMLQDLLRKTLRDVRRFVHNLRPSILDHLGLLATLRGLASDLEERDGIETEVTVTGEPRRLMPEEELILFRIAQETLNNVRRHARASRVFIQLDFGASDVHMLIKDDGRGFKVPDRIDDLMVTDKLGLVGMYERARIINGILTLRSTPGQGTVVELEAPVHPVDGDNAAQDA